MAVSNRVGLACFIYAYFYAVFYFPTRYYRRNNTDGILNGNLLEFKLNITDLNACLFQAIKYLSAMRIKGEPIPSNVLLISLNSATIYVYNSADYLKNIESVYVGGASKENKGFVANAFTKKLNYSEKQWERNRT